MEKPPVNPVDKVELPKAEQPVEHFSLSKQEKNIQEVFKLCPELKNIASENIESDKDIVIELGRIKEESTLGKVQNIQVYYKGELIIDTDSRGSNKLNVVTKEDGTSYVGDVYLPTELQGQGLGIKILQKVADTLDTKIIPTYLSTGGHASDNAKKMWGKVGNEILPSHEAEKLYAKYLETIFPKSELKEIFYHGTNNEFDKFNLDFVGVATNNKYRTVFLTPDIKLAKEYGKKVMPVIFNLVGDDKKSLEDLKKLILLDSKIAQENKEIFNKANYGEIEDFFLPSSKENDTGKTLEDYLLKLGVTGRKLENGVVEIFDTDQIHILGSKADIEKFKEFVSKKESSVLGKQELYNKIKSEIENVQILEVDKDHEGNLLAPNGKKSNLPELEWKMTRTPSFIKFFGNWKEKYNKEQYDLWLKYQEKQTCEDYIKRYQEYKESQKNKSLQALENTRERNDKEEVKKWTEYHLKQIKEWEDFYQKDIIRLSQKVSKLQAELINSGFNIHSYDLDYTKVLDENGEPLLLYRGTDFTPDENGKFVIPKKNIDGNEFEVGVFFGNKEEAKHHHEGRKIEGKTSKLYKVFVDGRNFKIFDSKPNYWANPKDSQEWRGKYDGVWVKKNENEETRTGGDVNLLDYVAFNPDDVLIVGVE